MDEEEKNMTEEQIKERRTKEAEEKKAKDEEEKKKREEELAKRKEVGPGLTGEMIMFSHSCPSFSSSNLCFPTQLTEFQGASIPFPGTHFF